MRIAITRAYLLCFVTLGLLSPSLAVQPVFVNLKEIADLRSTSGIPGGMPAFAQTDEELFKSVDEVIQKIVFESVHEVSLETYLQVWPGSGSVGELNQRIHEDIAGRLKKMGITVGKASISERPVLALNLQLIQIPDSARYYGYNLELALCEKVTLQRQSGGDPPAKTYRFRESGYFTIANLFHDLKAAYTRLLDSLQQALELSKTAN